MALGAVVAAALTDHSARAWSLTVGGLEMITAGATAGQRSGTLLETVKVKEAMRGRVSSMTFLVDDPPVSIAIAEGSIVRLHDVTRDVPVFLGFVQTVTGRTVGLGRTLEISAVGVEVALDWLLIPSATIPVGTKLDDAVQILVAAAIGIGFPLRAFSQGFIAPSQAFPVGNLTAGIVTTYAVTITGQTLRQALYALAAAINVGGVNQADFTVDFYGGLRAGPILPYWNFSDWTVIALTVDGTATPKIGADLEHVADYSAAVHQVYVVGANANGSGIVSDGSGILGPVETLSDSSSDSATKRDQIGQTYLAQRTAAIRGEVTLEHERNVGSAGAEIHTGTILRLTDASLAVAAQDYLIGAIDKTFTAAGEIWRVTYGGHPPSAVGTLRKITRSLS